MAEAKRQGKHIGRKKGTTKDRDQMLKDYKQVVKCLNDGQTVKDTAKICEVNPSTVMRVKKLLQEKEEAV